MKLGNDTLAFEDFKSSARDEKFDAVKKVIELANLRDAFFIGRSEDIETNLNFWTKKCPNIAPYYDVSCNEATLVLETMARLGTKFCFRNRLELDQLLKVGIPGKDLFFRSSFKVASHMRYASSHGVNLISFENKEDLKKIATNSSNCKALFLLTQSLDNKESFSTTHLEDIMGTARNQGVEVVGVAVDPNFSFVDRAMENMKNVFDCARKSGHEISILDLGELYPVDDDLEAFEQKVESILSFVELLAEEIPETLTIMANPSKFVVKSAFCLAVRIVDSDVEPLTGKISYVINEGVHGAFRTLLEHDDVLKPEIVASGNNVVSKRSVVSDIVGPSRNFLDKICTDCLLDKCEVDDWIVFDNVGTLYMGDMNSVTINVGQLDIDASGNESFWFISRDDFMEDELFGVKDDHEDISEDDSQCSQSTSDQMNDEEDFIR